LSEVKYEKVRRINLEKKKFSGRVWRLGRLVSTIYDRDRDVYLKSIEKWEDDEELAYSCLDVWKSRGYGGAPSSPASFFPKIHKRNCWITFGQNSMLGKYFKGGWIETFRRGVIESPLHQYDLVSAYLWAGSLGFPSKYRPYQSGDKNFIVIFKQSKINFKLPALFHDRLCIIQNQDIDTYGLRGDIVRGISWLSSDVVTILDDFYELQTLQLPEKAYKRITQSYWGLWASSRLLHLDIWDNGRIVKTVDSWNRFQNFLWAHLIMHRVARRMFELASSGAVLCYVDAVLTAERFPTGENLGDWQYKGYYPKGVTVINAGFWTPNPAPKNLREYLKHSGIAGR